MEIGIGIGKENGKLVLRDFRLTGSVRPGKVGVTSLGFSGGLRSQVYEKKWRVWTKGFRRRKGLGVFGLGPGQRDRILGESGGLRRSHSETRTGWEPRN